MCVGLCACVLHDDDVGLNVLGCQTDILRTYIYVERERDTRSLYNMCVNDVNVLAN